MTCNLFFTAGRLFFWPTLVDEAYTTKTCGLRGQLHQTTGAKSFGTPPLSLDDRDANGARNILFLNAASIAFACYPRVNLSPGTLKLVLEFVSLRCTAFLIFRCHWSTLMYPPLFFLFAMDVSDLSVAEVAELLQELTGSDYAKLVKTEAIDGTALQRTFTSLPH